MQRSSQNHLRQTSFLIPEHKNLNIHNKTTYYNPNIYWKAILNNFYSALKKQGREGNTLFYIVVCSLTRKLYREQAVQL